MKVYISTDEEYPVYSLSSNTEFNHEIDIPIEMKNWIEKTTTEFNTVQDWIDYLLPRSYYNHEECGYNHNDDTN